jgi:FtsH-binding integral membrane protein
MEYRDPFAKVSTASYGQSQAATYDVGLRAYMLKIYNYMASALALTGITALVAANSPALLSALYKVTESGQIAGMTGLGWLVAFAPLGMVMWLSFGVNRMSTTMAQGVFWAFSAVMGLSLTSIFLMYTGESIARAFFITAGTFGAMSLYGYTTKRDLTGIGSFLIMGVWGLLIASIVNIFLGSSTVSFAVSALAVLIFTGLTAYDTQKLKHMYYEVAGNTQMMAKASIMGALNLYMDFINIFIHLLRFVGERR